MLGSGAIFIVKTLIFGIVFGILFVNLPGGEVKFWLTVSIAGAACIFLIIGIARTREGPDGKLKVSRFLYAGAFCVAIALSVCITLLFAI